MKPATRIFLAILGVFIGVWVLRGLGLLTFLPGMVVWVLLFATIGAGVVSKMQRTIR